MRRPRVRYALEPHSGSFEIDGYNWAKPFSNFLPGIAGKWGIPLWCYYVNRGQAVCSVGVRDKNGQILEFQSFNLAVSRVNREGFRTFLKIDGGPVYEPFQRVSAAGIRQRMRMSPSEVSIWERHKGLGIEIEVREDSVYVPPDQTLEIVPDLGGAIPSISDAPWPAFPAASPVRSSERLAGLEMDCKLPITPKNVLTQQILIL